MYYWSSAFHITTCVISALAVITNTAVCLIVLFKKSMQTYTNGFVVSLAFSDVITGAVLFINYLDLSILSRVLLNIFYGIVLFCGVANVCLSSLDRYFAITKPLKYRQAMPIYFPFLIAGSWIGSVIYAVLPFSWNGESNLTAMNVYRCSVVLALIFPYGIILFVYYRMFLTVRRSARACLASHQQRIQAMRAATAFRVVKCFVVVSVVFLCSWFPVNYITIASVVNKSLPPFVEHASPIALALGSLANPCIYSFIKPDFREAIRKLLSCKERVSVEQHRPYVLEERIRGHTYVATEPLSFDTKL